MSLFRFFWTCSWCFSTHVYSIEPILSISQTSDTPFFTRVSSLFSIGWGLKLLFTPGCSQKQCMWDPRTLKFNFHFDFEWSDTNLFWEVLLLIFHSFCPIAYVSHVLEMLNERSINFVGEFYTFFHNSLPINVFTRNNLACSAGKNGGYACFRQRRLFGPVSVKGTAVRSVTEIDISRALLYQHT